MSEKSRIIHLLVTPLCKRDCPHCCNKQYDLGSVPVVTEKELKNCHTVLITGGEPYAFTLPDKIARHLKRKYPNINRVYVYTNALEYYVYNKSDNENIDGVSMSIKTELDKRTFEYIVNSRNLLKLESNRLYVFDDRLVPSDLGNFTLVKREWQENFVPADDSIFRRL